jgi:hypothetical protein
MWFLPDRKQSYEFERHLPKQALQVVCPMPSIDFPGTRVVDGF